MADDNPCLNAFHYFGSADWQKGDEDTGPFPPPFKLGNDLSLGRDYYEGNPPALRPDFPSVGTNGDFTSPQTFDPAFKRKLLGGIDERCFLPFAPCFSSNLLNFAIDNCALLLVLAGCLRNLENGDKIDLTTFLQTWLGADTRVSYDDGNADNPPTCIAQTPRNNLIILAGTHTWDLIGRQLRSGIGAPTQFGTIRTLPLWWDSATYVLDILADDLVDFDKPTFLVGHSMGGATACIIWHRLHEVRPGTVFRLVTYGCPKPGDSAFTEKLRLFSTGTHVANDLDPVPTIPPDSTFKAALELVFPVLPDAWFTQWSPLHRYLHLRAGGIFEVGPWEGLNLEQYVQFIIAQLLRVGGGMPTTHEITSYINKIGLHCPEPELPFDADCYELLFLPDEFGPGGEVLAGGGALPVASGSRVLFNGGGLLTRAGLPAGIVLDGGGDLGTVPGPAGILLDGGGDLGTVSGPAGIVLDGSGVFAGSPGPNCSSALTLTLGVPHSFTTSMTAARWYVIPVTSGTLYHVKFTTAPSDGTTAPINHGATCASLTIVGVISNAHVCQEYTPAVDENLYVDVGIDLFGSVPYTIVIDTGHC